MNYRLLCTFIVAMLLGGAVVADDCIPEGVEQSANAASLPATLPQAFPLPQTYVVLSASEAPADQFNPYPYAMAEVLADGDPETIFAFYEKQLPDSGYRIVMWENDSGAMGFRVRGDGIDQATISINSYDCKVLIGLNFSLLP